MDVTGISPGADFARVIQDTVGTCHVLIAIIGRHWTTITDASNRRRLDLADDYVRHEIATALSRNITVIPILVRGAEMPSREVLPPDLAALSTRNALEISDGDFDHDVERLIEVLENVCGEPRPVATAPTSTARSNCLIFAVIGILAGGALLLVVFLLLLGYSSHNNQSVVQPSANPGYSQTPSGASSPESSETQQDNAVTFNPVGQWIITFVENGKQMHYDLVIKPDGTYAADDEIGQWRYSPEEEKLTLGDQFVITIEALDGNAFIGHVQTDNARFPFRLTPN